MLLRSAVVSSSYYRILAVLSVISYICRSTSVTVAPILLYRLFLALAVALDSFLARRLKASDKIVLDFDQCILRFFLNLFSSIKILLTQISSIQKIIPSLSCLSCSFNGCFLRL